MTAAFGLGSDREGSPGRIGHISEETVTVLHFSTAALHPTT